MKKIKLWKHRNKIYYALWMENGKRRRKSLKTKEVRIAKRLLKDFERNLVAGNIVPLSTHKLLNPTFPEFMEEFLDHVSATLALSTYCLYGDALEKGRRAWGKIPIQHITTRHLDGLVANMKKGGLKPPTINKNMRHLKAALKKAVVWEYLKKPLAFPKPLPEEKRQRALEQSQIKKLAAKTTDQVFLDFWMLSAYTGLRSGEILRLTPKDVDSPPGYLRISAKQKNKTESVIPINDGAREILDRRVANCDSKRLFSYTTVEAVSKRFKRLAYRAGLPHVRFHDLRHTYGTSLALKNVPGTQIQPLMRHKTYASTQVYVNISPEHLKKASNKVKYGPILVKKGKKAE